MTVYNKLLIIAIVLICALLAFSPSASFVGVLLELAAVYFICGFLLNKLCPKSLSAKYALLGIWTLLSIGMILNLNWFTVANGGTAVAPVLFNDDANVAWEYMQSIVNNTESAIHFSRRGYGTLLAFLCMGGTPTIDSLLSVNMLAIIVAILLTAATSSEIANVDKSKSFTTAMILLGSVACFLGSGVLLIKDAFCCLIVSAVLYAVFTSKSRPTTCSILLLCTLLAAVIRPKMLIFMAMIPAAGIVSNRKRAPEFSFMILLLASVYAVVINSYYGTVITDIQQGELHFNLGETENSGRLAAYSAISGDYANMSVLSRLLRLPFSFAVQWLTPLPWAFSRDMVFGPSQAWMHVSFMWYAIGGMALYCLIFKLKSMPKAASASLIVSFVAMLSVAFITGGTVSRYCLPWIPAMIPAATWLVAENNYKTKSFKVWAIAYGTLVLIAAAVAIAVLNISNGGHTWEAS